MARWAASKGTKRTVSFTAALHAAVRRGDTVPTAREWRQYDRDRADATLILRAATFLRDDPSRASYAGLSRDEDAYPLAALLEILATVLPDLDSGVRWADDRVVPGAARGDDGRSRAPTDPTPMTTRSAPPRPARTEGLRRSRGGGCAQSATGQRRVMCLPSAGE
jgi:hypothetical protein